MIQALDILMVVTSNKAEPDWDGAQRAIDSFSLEQLLDEGINASFDLSEIPDPFAGGSEKNLALLKEAKLQLTSDLYFLRQTDLSGAPGFRVFHADDRKIYLAWTDDPDEGLAQPYGAIDRLTSADVLQAAGFEVGIPGRV